MDRHRDDTTASLACTAALISYDRDTNAVRARADALTATDRAQLAARPSEASRINRIALRCLLDRVAAPEIAAADIETTSSGKPILADGPPISTSHTDGYGLVVVASTACDADIGCDIERRASLKMSDNRRNHLRTAVGNLPSQTGALRVDDDCALRAVLADERLTGVVADLAAWTALEARGKCTGEGVFGLAAQLGVFAGLRPSVRRPPEQMALVQAISVETAEQPIALSIATTATNLSVELMPITKLLV